MPKIQTIAKIKIPKKIGKLNPKTRKLLAEGLIDHIRDRTRKGQGKNEKPWKYSRARKYSKDYKKLPPVNLLDTEAMLNAIEIIKSTPNQINIGIKSSNKEYGKAKGNILGSYGKKPDPKKARNFLELGRNDINKVINKMDNELTSKIVSSINKKDLVQGIPS